MIGLGSLRGWAWIAVRDSGAGIAEADRAAIFERFRRSSVVDGRRTGGGAGLGLSIARQIVESHQGRITLFSEVGGGCTFIIWLPDRAIAGYDERPESAPDLDPLAGAGYAAWT